MIPPGRLEEAGIPGWKVSFHDHPKITAHRVCVLTSPEYCPVRKTGLMFAATAVADAVAFSHAIKIAKEAINGQVN